MARSWALAGFKSKNAVHKLVGKLIELGVVAKDTTGRLIPKRLGTALPVLGVVAAGWPSPAEEELLDTMTLDEYLIQNKEATYLLQVKGDSMIEAGIMPGDHVLVERGAEPKDGDIVIAEVDGSWTMKFFRKRGSRVVLVPGNKKYKPSPQKKSCALLLSSKPSSENTSANAPRSCPILRSPSTAFHAPLYTLTVMRFSRLASRPATRPYKANLSSPEKSAGLLPP